MAVDSSTTVRPYHGGDVPALVALFARVFGRAITVDHWRWKLEANRAPACNVWVAADGDRPVFQYAGIAQRYQLAGTEVVGMVSVDTMTDPDYRRRGLLTRVAAEAYEAWRAGGAAFVIGLPNQQWGSRTSALGWVELFGLGWFAYPLRPHALAARRFRLPWLRHLPFVGALWNAYQRGRRRHDTSIEIAEIASADAGLDDLWTRLRTRHAFGAVRDRAWVQWRFLASPQRQYQVLVARRAGRTLGYLAYSVTQADSHTVALLAEIVTEPGDEVARDALLDACFQRLQAAGVEVTATLAVPDTELAGWLRRRGFFRGSGFSVQLVPLAAQLPLERLRDRHEWLLTGADFDVV